MRKLTKELLNHFTPTPLSFLWIEQPSVTNAALFIALAAGRVFLNKPSPRSSPVLAARMLLRYSWVIKVPNQTEAVIRIYIWKECWSKTQTLFWWDSLVALNTCHRCASHFIILLRCSKSNVTDGIWHVAYFTLFTVLTFFVKQINTHRHCW